MKVLLKSLLGARGCFLLKSLWICFLWASGLLRYARWRIARSAGIVVLTFHRVMPADQHGLTYSPQGMLVAEETFDAFVRYVSKRFLMISLAEEPAWTCENPGPRIALTFDDGWIDNFHYAEPISRRHNVPLTIFVCPSKVGLSLPYWPERVSSLACKLRSTKSAARQADHILDLWSSERAYSERPSISSTEGAEHLIKLLKKESPPERERLLDQIAAIANTVAASDGGSVDATMTWENIRCLDAAGVVFGSHTNSHEILPWISLSDAESELTRGKRAIEDHLGRPCPLFAYPNGDWSPEVRGLVGQAGHKFAFMNDTGIWNRETDPLLIPRSNIWEGTLIGPSGRFSPRAFEYGTFWRAYRNRKQKLREVYHLGQSECIQNQIL